MKAAFLVLFIFAIGCSSQKTTVSTQEKKEPTVVALKTYEVATASAASQRLAVYKAKQFQKSSNTFANVQPATVITAEVTFTKKEIFDRDFLYGADVQYSSLREEGFDLFLQSMAQGHYIGRFRIVGDRLQFSAKTDSNVESDVNHPERLLNEFPIIKQDDQTVTVAIRQASPVLNTYIDNAKALPARASWVRSAEFVTQGNYLMYETSIETSNGFVIEFMETIFPRETLVNDTHKPMYNDEALNPMAKRFRFIDNGNIFVNIQDKGRVKTKVASRFDYASGKPVNWYVTANVPQKYLPLVQAGVEGWNRYSQAMWKTDIVKFGGTLPVGVKIGDPRYNVINWDAVAEAGAAYESQASDPLTGIQSHSLIYMPEAWFNIGKKYWDAGAPSEPAQQIVKRIQEKIEGSTFLGRKLNVRCLRDAFEHISVEARLTPEEFGMELIKGTLMHEVGHALGLDHNFKGSLSFDPDDDKTAVTTSIMDYNQFQLEVKVFENLQSANGPILEYDRQILSVLYNEGKDLTDKDPVLPACNDEETDDREGGADPLCVRYDAGTDPTKQLSRTVELIRDPTAKLGPIRSLAASVESLAKDLPEAATIKTEEEVKKALEKHAAQLKGVVSFYYGTGAQSLGSMMRANVRSLYVFQEDSLPENYVEADMRKRVIDAFDYVVKMETVDSKVKSRIDDLGNGVKTWFQSTTYFAGLTRDQQEKATELVKSWNDIENSFDKEILSKTRTRLWGTLVRVSTAPFFLSPGPAQDIEKTVIDILERATTEPAGSVVRLTEERVAAATALLTYKDTFEGVDAIDRAKTKLKSEITRSSAALEREAARKIYKVLAP